VTGKKREKFTVGFVITNYIPQTNAEKCKKGVKQKAISQRKSNRQKVIPM